MIRKKLSYIPINMVTSLSSWFFPFLVLTEFTTIDDRMAIIVSTYIYLARVFQASELDYLEDRIKKLESNE
jgi:hypothetical protein